MLNPDNSYCFPEVEMDKSNNNYFLNDKNSYLTKQSFKRCQIVNWTLLSLHGVLLEITLTVPLNNGNFYLM